MARLYISPKIAIYLLVFAIAVVCNSLSKTILNDATKKPCTKSHGHKNHMALLSSKITKFATSLPTTLSAKTKTPCTKTHNHGQGKRTTLPSSATSALHTQSKTSATEPTTACKPIDCVISEWSAWKGCSATCGISGSKHRCRKIVVSPSCGGVCPYALKETSVCNRICLNGGEMAKQGCKCPSGYNGACCEKVNGNWSPWGEWGLCSKSCDTGIQKRTRKCNQPAPSGGGLDCAGPRMETVDCNKQECPVNGGWSAWGDWSHCSQSCGEGKKFRQRQCNNPFPSNGGLPCIGLMLLTAKCQLEECKTPVDGGWSQWLEWGQCSKTCGWGLRMRTRVCNNPLPSDGGRLCSGLSHQEEKCFFRCKVPGNGGSGAEGGFGKRHAKPHATAFHRNKLPLSKSRDIKGPKRRLFSYENDKLIQNFDVFIQKHNEEAIKRDDKTNVSGPWTRWSSCSTTCGQGQRFRTRACIELANPCSGVPMDVQLCNLGKCDI